MSAGKKDKDRKRKENYDTGGGTFNLKQEITETKEEVLSSV